MTLDATKIIVDGTTCYSHIPVEYDILVITQSEAKLRISVNNKEIIQMYL